MVTPMPRFNDPLSTVVEARDGSLLGARIAADGQWRFPASDSVPYKFEKALLTYEDRYFHYHPGVNPVSMVRAVILNVKSGTIISGGSTITMQVARIAGKIGPRTYRRKIVEILSALKLEILRSKKRILLDYISNAPFGGNIVGLEAASWKYGGTSPFNMSWAEAAAYAVLPNSPSLVNPGRNRDMLKTKRDKLLLEMYHRGFFDSITLELSTEEPVLSDAKPIPMVAQHLTDYFHRTMEGKRIVTTIDYNLQRRVSERVHQHSAILSMNQISNAACIIISPNSGEILAYIGNSIADTSGGNGYYVDILSSPRSTGSILKPLLYAGMLTSGELLPNTILPDIPIRFQGFAPRNFNGAFSGAVPASLALSRSLNVPAVKMLQDYTPERFLLLLRRTGIASFNNEADHYGLSMILGGGEASLFELAGMYASMSRVLMRYNAEGRYLVNDYHQPVMVRIERTVEAETVDENPPLSAGAIWLTLNTLREVNRPESESGWQFMGSTPPVAWKTGTSFGFRDAWAIATTPEYVVGVWAGNADGEGRPGLTGTAAAAPLLFEIIADIRPEQWFGKPGGDELTIVKICSESGYRAGPDCPETTEQWIPVSGLRSAACPYHKIIHLNRERTRRVNSSCYDPGEIINESRFILPPAMEYFYRRSNTGYRPLPPMAAGCSDDRKIAEMEFIYPPAGSSLFIPRDHTGERGKIIAEAVHRNSGATLFWHLDENYLGSTRTIHQMDLMAGIGSHKLTIVDDAGNIEVTSFVIVSGER